MPKVLNHIHFQDGKGESVIFLHGIEEDGSFWFPIDRAVARSRHSISIDLLGYGQSPKNAQLPYTKKNHVDALFNTLQTNVPGEKVTLVGHSMGCYIALGFAANHPDLVKNVILISPVIILKDLEIKEDALADAIKEETLESVGAIRKFFSKLARSPKTAPEVSKSLTRFASSSKNVRELVEAQDFPGDLAKIPGITVRMIYGAIDPLVVPDNIHYLAKKYPNVIASNLPAGHDPVHQQPEAIFRAIVPEARSVPDVIYKKNWRE